MRFRITVRGDGMELRGSYFAQTPDDLGVFAKAMEPFGFVIASIAEDDDA